MRSIVWYETLAENLRDVMITPDINLVQNTGFLIILHGNITIRQSLYPETKNMILEWNAKNEKDRNVRIFCSEVFEPW